MNLELIITLTIFCSTNQSDKIQIKNVLSYSGLRFNYLMELSGFRPHPDVVTVNPVPADKEINVK